MFWNLIRIWFTSQKSSGFISVTAKIFSLCMYVYSFQIRWSGLIKIKSDLSIEACCLIVFFPPVLFSLSPLFDILSLFMLLSHALCRLLFTWIVHIFVEYSISFFFSHLLRIQTESFPFSIVTLVISPQTVLTLNPPKEHIDWFPYLSYVRCATQA